MSLISESVAAAATLLIATDSTLREITLLSLRVSASATLIAALIGLPLGAWVALTGSRLRLPIVVVLNASMGLPPVVIGLAAIRPRRRDRPSSR